MTDEHRRKISIALMGNKNYIRNIGKKFTKEHRINLSKAHSGVPSNMKGKHHSEETKRKISEIKKKNPNRYWLGKKRSEKTKEKISKTQNRGLTPEIKKIRNSLEVKLWRMSVFSRDGFKCQKCFAYGGELNAHHILNFSKYKELRFAIDNGLTFCKRCHLVFHKKYGRKNNNEQIVEFLYGG